jgi:hypothetical protein
MPTQQSLITYQAYASSDCLDRLVERFGDSLEGLTAIDKLDLIGSLAFWQSADTEHQHTDQPSIRLGEYLGIHHELQIATSRELDEALEILADCSDGDAMTLLVTLPCQLRDGVYAE